MSTGPTIARHKSKQDYETPPEFIAACVARFGPIGFDLAASFENKKALYFYSKEKDSLAMPWNNRHGICWLNPEFSDITPWARRCNEAGKAGVRILFLTPASVGANWFRDYVHHRAMVLALNGRITFVGQKDPYPRDCILSAYGFGVVGFDVWKWA